MTVLSLDLNVSRFDQLLGARRGLAGALLPRTSDGVPADRDAVFTQNHETLKYRTLRRNAYRRVELADALMSFQAAGGDLVTDANAAWSLDLLVETWAAAFVEDRRQPIDDMLDDLGIRGCFDQKAIGRMTTTTSKRIAEAIGGAEAVREVLARAASGADVLTVLDQRAVSHLQAAFVDALAPAADRRRVDLAKALGIPEAKQAKWRKAFAAYLAEPHTPRAAALAVLQS